MAPDASSAMISELMLLLKSRKLAPLKPAPDDQEAGERGPGRYRAMPAAKRGLVRVRNAAARAASRSSTVEAKPRENLMSDGSALVLGGGGVAGIAWITGLLTGLADAGDDV